MSFESDRGIPDPFLKDYLVTNKYLDELIRATDRVLTDRPIASVDAAFFIGRSWFDAEKWGVYGVCEEFYRSGRVRYVALYGSDGQLHGTLEPNIAAPSKHYARARLVKLGVPDDDIFDSALANPLENNTKTETQGLLKLAEEKGWKRVVAVANPHQVLRAMLGMVKIINDRGLDIDVYTAAPTNTNWEKRVRGSQGKEWKTRSAHIDDEYIRIPRYQASGDLASVEELFRYLEIRDDRQAS